MTWGGKLIKGWTHIKLKQKQKSVTEFKIGVCIPISGMFLMATVKGHLFYLPSGL